MKNAQLWKSLVPVVVNLLLGVPAIVPMFLIWYYLSNGPFADAGWTRRDPNENDGTTLWLVIVVPVVAVFGGLWTLANVWMRRRLVADAPPYPYWLVSAALTAAPFFLATGFG